MVDPMKNYILGCPGQEVIGSKVIGSVGYFTPILETNIETYLDVPGSQDQWLVQ